MTEALRGAEGCVEKKLQTWHQEMRWSWVLLCGCQLSIAQQLIILPNESTENVNLLYNIMIRKS